MPRQSRIDAPGALHHIIDTQPLSFAAKEHQYPDFNGNAAASDRLCYWAVRELGISLSELGRRLQLSKAAVSLSVKRGEKPAKQHNFSLI